MPYAFVDMGNNIIWRLPGDAPPRTGEVMQQLFDQFQDFVEQHGRTGLCAADVHLIEMYDVPIRLHLDKVKGHARFAVRRDNP